MGVGCGVWEGASDNLPCYLARAPCRSPPSSHHHPHTTPLTPPPSAHAKYVSNIFLIQRGVAVRGGRRQPACCTLPGLGPLTRRLCFARCVAQVESRFVDAARGGTKSHFVRGRSTVYAPLPLAYYHNNSYRSVT